eukprot:gnl/TRDRNA2_/TRDRNA2_183775_c0_seq1.p1 gnl/TRDRNA2_/TRDRNA2_183775_c0~~gnl/TRDRNA2_/TRDRNA2_183775_c0_seq1.p1  ORF type:complete len:351 (+),score=78.62 gnl/TRDRNA2_/TRDRNA2_183775_c0_seq1:101-1153(+)
MPDTEKVKTEVPIKKERTVDASGDGGVISDSADHLLDRILRNAVGGGTKTEAGVKGEHGVKSEKGVIKVEGVKGESVKGENVKGENVKGENVKGEAMKAEGQLVKAEGVKSEAAKVKAELGLALATGKKRSRSRSRKKKRSRSRGRRRSRSRKRKRKRSSSSSSSAKSPTTAAMQGLPQARVVAVRGHWAQYLSPAGETFYKNVLSSEVQWQKPPDFDCQPSRRAGEMTPGPGEAACYIFHMPPEWGEADLMQLFAPFGQVASAHVQRDANGFSRSCGFVTYTTSDAANQACNMMNGFGVDGKFLKVSLTQFTGTSGPGGGPGGPGGPAGPGQQGIAGALPGAGGLPIRG